MKDLTGYIDTYIGSVSHLLQATTPCVQSPHGAAVIQPCFRKGMRDVYNSDKIFGFTAGCATVMPTLYDGQPDYDRDGSVFDHDFETARADCYEVELEDIQVKEKHTATDNYGCLVFTFLQPARHYRLALHINGNGTAVKKGGKLYLTNGIQTDGNCVTYTIFGIEDVIAVEKFENENGYSLLLSYDKNEISLPFAMSVNDMDDTEASYDEQVKGKSFNDLHTRCKNAWNTLLNKVQLTGGSEQMKTVFYTALYRSTCRMHCYSVNGHYRGFDGKLHDDNGHKYYTGDGIWDTYRTMHPLQLLLEPQVHEDCLCSYLRMYEQSGWLPRFPSLTGNIPCMIGHHTVSLFAEAAAKGVPFDEKAAYEAAYKNATQRTMLPWTDGEADELTKYFYENGFIPALDEDEPETCGRVHSFENRQAVAVTLEHCYDDYCMSLLAKKAHRDEDEAFFSKRSQNYKKLYNTETGFFHPRKADGSFVKDFDPKFCGGWGGRKYFAENNAYIYRFAIQHDIEGLIELFGGRDIFADRLDDLFIEQYDDSMKCEFLAQYPDATGLVGQFCMGNEPSFHIPYLYNYCGQAYKTQRKIHELIKLWFTPTPTGICGDEDGGAMSAFLVFSAMGFYPVDPASGEYDIGSPLFDAVELTLPNGKTFTVNARGAGEKAKYIASAALNGKPLTKPRFSHLAMLEGGELTLEMSQKPNKELFKEEGRKAHP